MLNGRGGKLSSAAAKNVGKAKTAIGELCRAIAPFPSWESRKRYVFPLAEDVAFAPGAMVSITHMHLAWMSTVSLFRG